MKRRYALLPLATLILAALVLSLDVAALARGGGGGGGGGGRGGGGDAGGGGDRGGNGGGDRGRGEDRNPDRRRAKRADRALDENCRDQGHGTRKRCRKDERKRVTDRMMRKARDAANRRTVSQRSDA